MRFSSKFLYSTPDPNVASSYAEVVFLGRSNVGKSSLINALCDQKNLAKSSSTPGKTQLANFFEICLKDKRMYFVDLPGIGFAKMSKQKKNEISALISAFLLRKSIMVFVQLIDARHTDLAIDIDLKKHICQICKPDQRHIVVYTKTDKLKKQELAKLPKEGVHVCAPKKQGIDELKNIIIGHVFGNTSV